MKRILPYLIVLLAGLLIGGLATCHFVKPEIETRVETSTTVDTVYVTVEGQIDPPIPTPIEFPDIDNSIIVEYEKYDRQDFLKVRRYDIPFSDTLITGTARIDAVGFVHDFSFSYSLDYPIINKETVTTIEKTYYKKPFPIWVGAGVRTNVEQTQVYPRVGLHLKNLTTYYGYDPINNFHSVDVSIPLNTIF